MPQRSNTQITNRGHIITQNDRPTSNTIHVDNVDIGKSNNVISNENILDIQPTDDPTE